MSDYVFDEGFPLRRLLTIFYWIAGLVLFGTVGYCVVEGWGVADSFFMTVITVSTVGYGETNNLTSDGRIFTSVLIFVGLASMTGWTAMLTSFVVGCDLSGNFQRRRTLRMISALKDHAIVCGTGTLAKSVLERLIRKRIPTVVIDADEDELNALKSRMRRLHTVCGNPSDEFTLAQANILGAKHLFAATGSEVDNLLIGITCKDLGSGISVIAESNDISIANRMRKSGIDEVVSPCQLVGEHVCEMITQ